MVYLYSKAATRSSIVLCMFLVIVQAKGAVHQAVGENVWTYLDLGLDLGLEVSSNML